MDYVKTTIYSQDITFYSVFRQFFNSPDKMAIIVKKAE